MTLPQRLTLAIGLATALAASAARADEAKFFYEIQPAFENCGDDSLARARKEGNTLGIKSYDDLKNRKVGSISGGAADFYLRRIGVTTTPFKSQIEELQSLNQGRLDAVLEDDITYLEFVKSNPTNQLEPLWNIGVPEDLVNGGGYGMTRYGMRKEDCSLRVAYT